jgi:hypothetical protein
LATCFEASALARGPAVSQGERQAILPLRLRASAPRERLALATERRYLRDKGGAIYATFEIYGTVPLKSARVVSTVTWPPLSVVAALLTRIVPSESSAPMPMINVAFIIRLDPERIIVAPMRIPRPQQLRR